MPILTWECIIRGRCKVGYSSLRWKHCQAATNNVCLGTAEILHADSLVLVATSEAKLRFLKDVEGMY